VLKLPRDRRLSDMTAAYLEHRRATREKSTWSSDRSALNHLLDHIANHRPVHSIEPADLQAIIDAMTQKGYAASTLFTYRKSWQTFFRWHGPHDPTKDVTTPSRNQDDAPTFEPDELIRLRTAADKVARQRAEPNARLVIELGLCMGLRQGEIFALRWEAIDPDTRSVRIRWQIPKDSTTPKGLKGKRARTALIMPEWWALHREATGYICGMRGRPIGSRSQRDLITRILDTAGLNDVGMGYHVLRHTYARHFVEQGGGYESLQVGLGHKSITTTQTTYGHFREDAAAKLAGAAIYGG
jgi:site-specific recombinase XerD